jgi:hypothetical protein
VAASSDRKKHYGIDFGKRKEESSDFRARGLWAVEHLMAAARNAALNPVQGRLAARVEDWRWSSVRA